MRAVVSVSTEAFRPVIVRPSALALGCGVTFGSVLCFVFGVFFLCGPVEWSGVEWSGVEWSGVEWSGVERSGVEWSGLDWTGVDWNGVEWSGVEWSGVE